MANTTTTGDIDIGEHTQLAFATPLIGYQWPDASALNSRLASLIRDRQTRDGAGGYRSAVGGWQSSIDLFEWNDVCVADLKQRVWRLVSPLLANTLNEDARSRLQCRLEGWANILVSGQYNAVHNHPGSLWSGVYYVRTGASDPAQATSGELEFIDPRAGANMASLPGSLHGGNLRLRPADGFMVLFPGWLQHMVHPYFGTGERITVAFNLVCSQSAPNSAP